jgi:hypothetical protein
MHACGVVWCSRRRVLHVFDGTRRHQGPAGCAPHFVRSVGEYRDLERERESFVLGVPIRHKMKEREGRACMIELHCIALNRRNRQERCS